MTRAEQYIKDYTRGCSNELGSTQYNDGKKIISYHEWLTPENAMAVAEIAREEVIGKACEWLRTCNYTFPYKMIEEFKKAMEEVKV